MTVEELRNRYPRFTFSSFTHELTAAGLQVTYTYTLGEDHSFTHTIGITDVTDAHLKNLSEGELEEYLFSIGMSELLNYWKLTASPEVHIAAGPLSSDQLAWWKDLLLQGMGEYFFVNNIDFTSDDFVAFSVQKERATVKTPEFPTIPPVSADSRFLVPIGGGKDSAVTLALLGKNFTDSVSGFMVNSIPSAEETLKASQVDSAVTISRKLDPNMLQMNAEGYLNGHVPISSVLAFMSVCAGRLFGFTHIAISNERSSNEGNVFFCDREVNHQYSKTFEFEKKFAQYCQSYLPEGTPHYFSFLRPLYELQIAQVFADYPEYHPIFRSCNRGQKTNSWCGNCPKCLFAFSLMVPFLGRDKTAQYFGKDMFADVSLFSLAEELLGVGEKKPFECVGTHEETICAFYLATKQYPASQLPSLLDKINSEILSKEENLEERSQQLLASWNNEHLIPTKLTNILEEALHG